ncbi:hypothetical protein CF319_g6528 [Tilletia indica]|nr:hypothetical protein CF319_g6528 [Tilletia indica]
MSLRTSTAPGGSSTAAPTHGSRTLTINATAAHEEDGQAGPSEQSTATLRLRAPTQARNEERPRRRRVVWADDTVDNEHLGKKSSKICCIYHKPRAFDESDSDESSASSGSDSEAGSGDDSDSSNPDSDSAASLSPPDSGDEGEGCSHPHHQKPVSFPFKHGKHPNAKAKSKSKKKKSGGGTRGGSRTQTITATETEQVKEADGAEEEEEVDRRSRRPNKYERGT